MGEGGATAFGGRDDLCGGDGPGAGGESGAWYQDGAGVFCGGDGVFSAAIVRAWVDYGAPSKMRGFFPFDRLRVRMTNLEVSPCSLGLLEEEGYGCGVLKDATSG